jgi:hypothetical protein
VSSRVEGEPAQRARGPARLHQQSGLHGEGGRLLPGDGEPGHVPLFVLGHELLGHQDDPVDGVVVADPEGPHHPVGFRRLHQRRYLGQLARSFEVRQQSAQILGQDRHLLLLHLQGEQGDAAAALQEEHPPARRALGAHGEDVEIAEVESGAHDRVLMTGPARPATRCC